MKLSFAFSPCPNDTFMFEPIVSGRVDTKGIDFEIILAEVEELNQQAFHSTYNVSKLSFNAFTKLTDRYRLLTAGSALGRGCGPILVARRDIDPSKLADAKIAIPGINTTANLLMDIALPHVTNKEVIVFHDIEEAVANCQVDAGLLIHESRFTYRKNGLVKVMDMGEYWENHTGLPIPLGGIAINKRLSQEVQATVNAVIFDSIDYAFRNPRSGIDYIQKHAQEMDTEVMCQHIDLYVNEYSKDLGVGGKSSIVRLFEELVKIGKIDTIPQDIFVK